MSQRKEAQMVLPPRELFDDSGKVLYGETGDAGQILIPAYKIDIPKTGGILVWHRGCKYPKKGWPFPQAMNSIDVVKRAMMNSLRLLNNKLIRPVLIPYVIIPPLRKKVTKIVLDSFADYSDVVFRRMGTYLAPQYYCDFVREVYRAGMIVAQKRDTRTLAEFKTGQYYADSVTYQIIVLAICQILEYDDAYRYRIQDIFKDFSKEAFNQNPRKELMRIISIMAERDKTAMGGGGIKDRVELISKLLKYLFYIKDFRDLVMEFFNEADTTKFKMDECDWYHSLPWVGYDFNGDPLPTRFAIRNTIDEQYNMEELFNPNEIPTV